MGNYTFSRDENGKRDWRIRRSPSHEDWWPFYLTSRTIRMMSVDASQVDEGQGSRIGDRGSGLISMFFKQLAIETAACQQTCPAYKSYVHWAHAPNSLNFYPLPSWWHFPPLLHLCMYVFMCIPAFYSTTFYRAGSSDQSNGTGRKSRKMKGVGAGENRYRCIDGILIIAPIATFIQANKSPNQTEMDLLWGLGMCGSMGLSPTCKYSWQAWNFPNAVGPTVQWALAEMCIEIGVGIRGRWTNCAASVRPSIKEHFARTVIMHGSLFVLLASTVGKYPFPTWFYIWFLLVGLI